MLAIEGSNAFTADMLTTVADTLPDFDRLKVETPDADDFVVFFEPPSLDERIVNQAALFSWCSSAAGTLGHWLARHQHLRLHRRIVIPAGLKWEVRDKLDQANVTEKVLFPGLDGLSRWLKRHYSPKSSVHSATRPSTPQQPDRSGSAPWRNRKTVRLVRAKTSPDRHRGAIAL